MNYISYIESLNAELNLLKQMKSSDLSGERVEIINKSTHKNNTKIRLVKIYTVLKNELISRNAISNLLSVSDRTSYNLILYLLKLDLIEPVAGYGKGKYKFK